MTPTYTRSIVLIAVILMDILGGMELDLFVPSFPEIQHVFHLSPSWVETLLSINFTGYCIGLFFAGGLGDHYGRKPVILCGLGIFIMGSVLCVSATGYPILLIGRFLQGLGVAAPATLSFLIISDVYSYKKQQSLLAILNGVMNVSVGLAPVIGSYIALYFQWRGSFIALLILGCLVSIITLIMPAPSGISPASDAQTLRPENTLSLRSYLPIFHSKPLMLLIGHFIPQIVPWWIFVGMTPLLYIKTLGVSLAHFGFYQGSLAFIFALGSLSFGFFIHRYDQMKLLYFSAYLFVFGILMLGVVIIVDSQIPLLITLAFLPFVMGQVIPSAILYPLCLNILPEAKGRVSSLITGGRLIFSALGLQLSGYLYQGSFKHTGLVMMGFMILAIIILFYMLRHPILIKHVSEAQ